MTYDAGLQNNIDRAVGHIGRIRWPLGVVALCGVAGAVYFALQPPQTIHQIVIEVHSRGTGVRSGDEVVATLAARLQQAGLSRNVGTRDRLVMESSENSRVSRSGSIVEEVTKTLDTEAGAQRDVLRPLLRTGPTALPMYLSIDTYIQGRDSELYALTR